MPKLVIFDLDNTLTDSRQPIPEMTADFLRKLLAETRVAVISGAAFWQFEKELLAPLCATERELENLYILTTSGAELWTHTKRRWNRVYVDKLKSSDKRRVRDALKKVLDVTDKELEPLLDDRDSGMTYSALGKDAPPDLKNPWDPDQGKRRAIVGRLSPMLQGLELKIGGTTSIDITNKGVDKAYGVNKIVEYLKIPKEEVVFVGDAVFSGGNDEPVKKTGVSVISTRGPAETRDILQDLLKAPETLETAFVSFPTPPVAFFSAEYALDDDSLTYAGGLGVFAADYIYEARDEDMPLACVGVWHLGKGERPVGPYSLLVMDGKPVTVEIPFEESEIRARVWVRRFGESVWLFLLDVNIPENSDIDRKIFAKIYATDDYTSIRQDVCLGIGGARLLAKLRIEPSIFHLNEGHTAFAAFELIARRTSEHKDRSVLGALKELSKRIVGTKHTILRAGVKVQEVDFTRYFGAYCDALGISSAELFEMGAGAEVRVFSTTHFMLNVAVRENAVSEIHAKFEKRMHPKSDLIPITNGVYIDRWRDRVWGNSPGELSDLALWETKRALRKKLIDIANNTGSSLDPDICTVVWARRFVSYKRPDTIVSDLARLERLVRGQMPIQIIIAGNVYQNEVEAELALMKIKDLAKRPEWKDRLAYISGYSIPLARVLAAGADVWLNTPIRGKEACGTSGMKAGLNGALEMSVSDGWIEEVDWKRKGWTLPETGTADTVYNLLEREVAPAFYEKEKGLPRKWISMMRKTMDIIEKRYSAGRMLSEYKRKLYRL